ncbi:MAG: hypothetical protein [Chaetfec virus UA24_244]|nr:MAG: hypothetical protein [Chaetfec virus UA24_244]
MYPYNFLAERPIEPPAAPSLPRCPVCGTETDTLYRDNDGNIVGCEYCVETVDAWSCTEEEDI